MDTIKFYRKYVWESISANCSSYGNNLSIYEQTQKSEKKKFENHD